MPALLLLRFLDAFIPFLGFVVIERDLDRGLAVVRGIMRLGREEERSYYADSDQDR